MTASGSSPGQDAPTEPPGPTDPHEATGPHRPTEPHGPTDPHRSVESHKPLGSHRPVQSHRHVESHEPVQSHGPAEPGSGWPGDPATPQTPVAHTAAEVMSLAESAGSIGELAARQSVCRACPRLVSWREQVAAEKRRSFAAEPYWGRPIPGWGADNPAVLIVGLAPAAHGGNRTGRVFTGDRSGDFLFASLYRCGLAVQPQSVRADDGQRLINARMAAVVRCAPPANKPTPAERDTCAPWLEAELTQLADSLRVIVCLGGFAWQAIWPSLAAAGFSLPRPRPAFGHGVEVLLESTQHQPEPPGTSPAGTSGAASAAKAAVKSTPDSRGSVLLIGCYHPSQQNTFTGRVTPEMLDAVFLRALERAL
jgi:uracil-DNA glycosylase family 4